MSRRLREEPKFTADPKQRELNETLMRFQRTVSDGQAAAELVSMARLRPQPELNDSGYLARPGLFLPVASETTILLAKPTPDTAGQPLAIYNASGGVVLLDPIDCTLNGADVGWLSPGLTILYPDASGWFGANTREVEFFAAGSLSGNATGAALTMTGATAPAAGLRRALIAAVAEQGGSIVSVNGIGLGGGVDGPGMARLRSVANATVLSQALALPEFLTASESTTNVVGAAGTSLLGFTLWVTGADQALAIQGVETTGSGTSLTSGSITTTRPGAMILDFMANDDETDTGTPGTDQTEIVDGSAGSATVSLQASYKPMPRPGTTTMSWSSLTNAANKAHIAIVIEPAEGI